ncbi:MAG: hypothetical protein PVJ60_01580 [Phycisphaerales bacterium]
MRKRNVINHLVFITVIAVISLVNTGRAFGQFIVQPMRLDLTSLPGRIIETALDLQSLDPNEVVAVDLRVTELSQEEDGQWQIVDSNDVNVSKLSSCSSWIQIGLDGVDIVPMGMERVPFAIRVPRRTRGFYAAAIVATVRPRLDIGGNVNVIVRFLIPVLIEVQGRPMRHRVEMGDLGLEFVPSREGNPASTNVTMRIDNKGGTRSRLKSFAEVKSFQDGHWKQVTRAEFRGTGIIPGAKLKLRTNIGKALPAGKYRISGLLYVDGSRAKRVTKEVTFESDPSITRVANDAAVDLYPPDIMINSRPGAIRTTSIRVYNASDEAVNVRTALALPPRLKGVVFGTLKGNDLDGTRFLRLEPETFTLPSNAERKLRVIASIPEGTEMYPCFYTLLGLSSTYSDGQSAGIRTGHICLLNDEVSIEPFVTGMRLNTAYKEESEYYVIARFGNFGQIHFTPISCRAAVLDTTLTPRKRVTLNSRKTGLMLPLEARDFSEVIDFAGLPEGIYRLAVVLEYAPGQTAMKQLAIQVRVQGGGRREIEVVGGDEINEPIPINW